MFAVYVHNWQILKALIRSCFDICPSIWQVFADCVRCNQTCVKLSYARSQSGLLNRCMLNDSWLFCTNSRVFCIMFNLQPSVWDHFKAMSDTSSNMMVAVYWFIVCLRRLTVLTSRHKCVYLLIRSRLGHPGYLSFLVQITINWEYC